MYEVNKGYIFSEFQWRTATLIILGSPAEFNALAALVNSQLVSLPPVEIVVFIYNILVKSVFVYIESENPHQGVVS